MANLIVKEGYLLKRGQMTAKRRYFILEHDERGTSTLSYWGSKQEMENAVPARGLLVLGADSRIQELASIGRRGFTVTAQRKAWSMASETNDPEEGKRWQAALTAAVAKAEAMKRNTIPESNTCLSIYGENRYSVTVSGTEFLLDRRYEDLRPLGHGAYGVVVSALDLALGQKVAIKKCPNIFEDPSDAKRIAREIRLLRHFQHPNIVKLTDLPPPPALDFFDVYMVAEKMDTDLHRVIYSGQTLTEEHIQFFMYQLMCGLKHIHSANVIHRDLKPSNILLNENCDLKICDFGLARDMGADAATEAANNLTEYVVTRWYRAPEIMLSSQEYSKAIDVWAAGCIFGEMLGRKPLFPGNDYIHQLKLITRIVGTPTSEADLWFVKNPKAKVFMLSLPPSPPQDLTKRLPGSGSEALDLLGRMLQLDYSKRISVDAALSHPFFASVRDEAMEYVCPTPVPWGDLEQCKPTCGNLQRAIWEDVAAFHPVAKESLEAQRGFPGWEGHGPGVREVDSVRQSGRRALSEADRMLESSLAPGQGAELEMAVELEGSRLQRESKGGMAFDGRGVSAVLGKPDNPGGESHGEAVAQAPRVTSMVVESHA